MARRLSDSGEKMEEGLLLQPIGSTGFNARPGSASPHSFGSESPSTIGLSPRKSSLRKSSNGSVDRRHSDGSERRKSSMRKGSAASVSDEKRRVSFPDNAEDVLGEADWDYDRTPIEVDFDGCFSRYVECCGLRRGVTPGIIFTNVARMRRRGTLFPCCVATLHISPSLPLQFDICISRGQPAKRG